MQETIVSKRLLGHRLDLIFFLKRFAYFPENETNYNLIKMKYNYSLAYLLYRFIFLLKSADGFRIRYHYGNKLKIFS